MQFLIWKSFFDFKEKFSYGSGFLNHEAGDFMILKRLLICLGSGRLAAHGPLEIWILPNDKEAHI